MNKTQLRVLSFKEMKDGWDHPSDPAPSHEVIDRVIEVLGKISTPLPYTYPSYLGGVRFEWEDPIQITFINDNTVELVNLVGTDEDDKIVSLDDTSLHTIIDEFYAEHTK